MCTVQNRQSLRWVSIENDIHLQTQYNGRDITLRKRWFRVDGWDSVHRTASQFHECMFHRNYNCPLKKDQQFNPKIDAPLYATTHKNRGYLENECHV